MTLSLEPCMPATLAMPAAYSIKGNHTLSLPPYQHNTIFYSTRRAGQSSIGEAYLLASGKANSPVGDWEAVCRLMTEPKPALLSCLLAPAAEGRKTQPQRPSGGAGNCSGMSTAARPSGAADGTGAGSGSISTATVMRPSGTAFGEANARPSCSSGMNPAGTLAAGATSSLVQPVAVPITTPQRLPNPPSNQALQQLPFQPPPPPASLFPHLQRLLLDGVALGLVSISLPSILVSFWSKCLNCL